MRGHICEIFSSIQGEGLLVGQRHIFARFSGCNLKCAFCDTPIAFDRSRERLVSGGELLATVRDLRPEHQALALTGGEPLQQAQFLAAWLPDVRATVKPPLPVLLETNGTLPDALKQVIELVDLVSMDIKLPSSTGERDFTDEHHVFLKIAQAKSVFVKVVVTPATDPTEFSTAVSLVSAMDREIPFFIQPVSPCGRIRKPPGPALLERLLQSAQGRLANVTVTPQMHKMMGVR